MAELSNYVIFKRWCRYVWAYESMRRKYPGIETNGPLEFALWAAAYRVAMGLVRG